MEIPGGDERSRSSEPMRILIALRGEHQIIVRHVVPHETVLVEDVVQQGEEGYSCTSRGGYEVVS
jgi:hypothetical protein